MTENEQARIAVLEAEIRHLRTEMAQESKRVTDAMGRIENRQSEMYDFMLEAKGGWKAFFAIAGVSGVLGALFSDIVSFVSVLPK